MCAFIVYGESRESKLELDEDSKRRITICIRILSDPQHFGTMCQIVTENCRGLHF